MLAGVRARWNPPEAPQLSSRAFGLAACVIALQVLVGWLLSSDATVALAIALLVPALALLLIRPQWFWILAFPANFLAKRVGPVGVDLSLADVAVLVAVLAALPSVPWHSRLLQQMQRLYAVYLSILLIVFAAAPDKETLISLAQRSSMFLGAILIGSALGHRGCLRPALVALLTASTIVSVEAMRRSIEIDFKPAYPFGLQKNAAGAMLGMSIVISFAALSVFRRTTVNAALLRICQMVLVGGLLATGARGAAIALAATLIVAVLRNEPGARRPATMAALVLVGLVAFSTVKSVDSEKTNNQFSSANSRIVTYNAAIKLWKRDPAVGVGIKYWRNPEFGNVVGFGEPHNVLVATLAETGLVGFAAFVILIFGTCVVALRRNSPLFRTAFLLIVFRLVDAQFGIFWVAVGGSLAWLFLGAAIGVEQAQADRITERDGPPGAIARGATPYRRPAPAWPTAVK